jgi:cytochrome P450
MPSGTALSPDPTPGLVENARGCPRGVLFGSRELDENFPAAVQELHAVSPVSADMRFEDTYFISRYDDVHAILQDWETYTSALGVGGLPGEVNRLIPLEVDPPEHTQWRRLLNPYLTRPRMRQHAPQIRALADALLDGIIGAGPVDLVPAYAQPLPAQVFFQEIFNLPVEQAAECLEYVEQAVFSEDYQEKVVGYGKLAGFVGPLAAAAMQAPVKPDDIVSAVCHAEIDGKPVTIEDAASTLMMLVLGGLETTSAVVGGIAHHLGTHPELREELRGSPELVQSTVEESLRMFGPATHLRRTVTCPVSLHGKELREGDTLQMSYVAANFDAAHFDDPNTFEPRRSPNRHIAFGVGVHRCIGSNLARLVIETSIQAIVDRVGDFEIEGEPRYRVSPTRALREITATLSAR